YAFSVFTHIDRKDFVGLLKTVAALLKPGGSFLFTCFTLTEFSRNMLANRQSVFKFNDSAFIDDGDVFIGERNDPLAFIAFDKMLLERMVWEAGLTITTLEYGAWMGGRLGSSLHDLIVVRRPFDLSNPDDIAKTPTVDRSAGNQ
ncbi:MAG TPA: class I SAM-dependent methyltransferase, partial [Novosphingobium sp.]|nr:class I SAM-dependent methyltransferase [Novosphingobium sp.]